MRKFLTISIIIVFSSIIFFGLMRQIDHALKASDRLDFAADEVYKLQEKNRKLKEKLTQAQSYETIEKIARDKLNLGREGETIIIIDEGLIDKILSNKIEVEEIKFSNLQGWFRLFFK